MSSENKAVLESANAAITAGDTEGFLAHCTEDIVWTAVGEMTLNGKDAVREWMADAYATPPKFSVTRLIGEDDYVTALGEIISRDDNGRPVPNLYCDVWRFRDGRMAELKAFVIPTK